MLVLLVVGVGDGDVMSRTELLGSHLDVVPDAGIAIGVLLNLTSLIEPLHDRVIAHTVSVDVLEVDLVNHHRSFGRDGRTDLGDANLLECEGRGDDFFVRHDSHGCDAGLVVD
jgi:hypothetical protein